MKIDKIVIVGGGSAGWMTASMLIKSYPEKDISLVESQTIPKIGVGESTFDGINEFLECLEINRKDFFIQTDATVKLGSRFKNFYSTDADDAYLFPFGRPVTKGTHAGFRDWITKKYLNPDLPQLDFAESFWAQAHFIKHNTLSDSFPDEYASFDPLWNTALQFDAIQFAEWLKTNYAIPRGVNHIIGTVSEIPVSEKGIDKLILEDGLEINADLFIDCTGFASVLLDKTLHEPFLSYQKYLPNNHAYAAQIPYVDIEVELENVTTGTAIANGWCWNTPTFSRLGTGYVYSDEFITHEEALEEYKQYIMTQLKFPRSRELVDSLKYNHLKIRSGIHERTWVKNVVGIGLSAGFIEPLESNGLFTVHEFLFALVTALSRPRVSQWEIDAYNIATKTQFDRFFDFVRIHYAFSVRDDSDYWRANLSRSYDDDKVGLVKELSTSRFLPSEVPALSATACIAYGMKYSLPGPMSIHRAQLPYMQNLLETIPEDIGKFELKQNLWDTFASQQKSAYQYNKEKYHE